MLPCRETIISCGRCATNDCLSTWSERFILYGSCLRWRRRQRENTHTEFTSVYIVQCSEQAAVRVPVMPISGTLLFRPREAFLLTSTEPAHWSVLEGRLLAQLDANRYTVYTIDIKISIVTFRLHLRCYEALQQATHNDSFSISLIFVSVFTCLRVGAISSAAVWRWVRE